MTTEHLKTKIADLEREIKSLKKELRIKDDACAKAEFETRELKMNNKKHNDDAVGFFNLLNNYQCCFFFFTINKFTII